MIALLAVLAALAVAAAGCGGSDEPAETAQTPTPTSTEAAPPADPVEAAPSTVSGANAFIGSIAVDPKDGTVMLGTGLGLFRLKPGAKDAKRVVGELRGPDGSGSVSSNLVVRYAGPGDLVASGHPEGGGGLPENLGLMRSRDAGNTWEPIAELGEADYHILQLTGKHVVGVKAEEREIRVSADGGQTFDARTPPDMPLDVVFDPSDPKRMVVTTEQGVFSSADEGGTWRPRDGVPSEQLAWGRQDALYRADPGGVIKVSADGGATWKDAGTVGITVNELAVDARGALYASVSGGIVKRSTDGGASWSRFVKLK
ncbi:MAG TPA: hypothetical protein VI006_26040 [Solirubrobacteraceae bacterium]